MSLSETQIESIFHQARGKNSPAERSAFIDGACGKDSALRDRVIALLSAEADASQFLSETPLHESPGSLIDRYQLLQQIGEGGFGVVYMAEQREPVKRKVALKIIKLGMDTKQVIARFEAERQALALMDHPNIAKVFDAGSTESGRPYFVMELVKGVPITEYCDTEHSSTEERLQLFVAVCQAIQHAHQKGIIHRDIKPSNVMVTLHDGKPVPKVIDFGIAKATNVELTQKTLFTEFRQFIGTPEYMSPEQAEMSGLDIDSRSDVYALGVLLYELLTGTTPLAPEKLRKAGMLEIHRLIREAETQKPSTRLSSLMHAGTNAKDSSLATQIARSRGSDPRALSKQVRGDLDWIVMKALEKDRTRRYETSVEFARDIERHLQHEVVEAGPPSKLYRCRKFVARNRVAVFTGSIVVLALIIGLTTATFGLLRAQDEAESKHAVADFYEQMFTSLVPYRVGAVETRREVSGPVGYADLTVADMLQQAGPRIGEAFADRPELEASVRRTFGWTFAGLGSGVEAVQQLSQALETQRKILSAEDPELMRTVSLLAFAIYLEGNPKRAADLVRPNITGHARYGGPDHELALDAQRFCANLLSFCGELEEAAGLAEDLLERSQRSLGENHPTTLWGRYLVACMDIAQGRFEAGIARLKTVRTLTARHFPNNPMHLLSILRLAVGMEDLGQYDEALRDITATIDGTARRFGAQHPMLWYLRCIAARIEARSGDPASADRKLQEIQREQQGKISAEHFMASFWALTRTEVLLFSGRYEEAAELAADLPKVLRAGYGDRGTQYLKGRYLQGCAVLELGGYAEAARSLGAVIRDTERLLPSGCKEMPAFRLAYGRSLMGLERYAEAETQLLQAYESGREMRGAEHEDVRTCASRLVDLYRAWGRPEKARDYEGR